MTKACERTTSEKVREALESVIKEEEDTKQLLDAYFDNLKERINMFDKPIDIGCECAQYLRTYERYCKAHNLNQQLKAYLGIETK